MSPETVKPGRRSRAEALGEWRWRNGKGRQWSSDDGREKPASRDMRGEKSEASTD